MALPLAAISRSTAALVSTMLVSSEMPACVKPVGYMPRQTQECDAAVLVRQHHR